MLLRMQATVWHHGDLQAGESAHRLPAQGIFPWAPFYDSPGLCCSGARIQNQCYITWSAFYRIHRNSHPGLTSNIHSGKSSRRLRTTMSHILTSLGTNWGCDCCSSSHQSFSWCPTCLFAIPTKQVPAKDLQAQPDFPSNSCPRLGTRTEQGGRFPWIATCFAAIRRMLWKPHHNDCTCHCCSYPSWKKNPNK